MSYKNLAKKLNTEVNVSINEDELVDAGPINPDGVEVASVSNEINEQIDDLASVEQAIEEFRVYKDSIKQYGKTDQVLHIMQSRGALEVMSTLVKVSNESLMSNSDEALLKSITLAEQSLMKSQEGLITDIGNSIVNMWRSLVDILTERNKYIDLQRKYVENLPDEEIANGLAKGALRVTSCVPSKRLSEIQAHVLKLFTNVDKIVNSVANDPYRFDKATYDLLKSITEYASTGAYLVRGSDMNNIGYVTKKDMLDLYTNLDKIYEGFVKSYNAYVRAWNTTVAMLKAKDAESGRNTGGSDIFRMLKETIDAIYTPYYWVMITADTCYQCIRTKR